MKRVQRIVRVASGAASIVLAAAPVFAYTPKWIQCEGQVAIETKTGNGVQTSTEPAQDIYIYDDDAKHLFKYSETRHSEDYEPVTLYTDKEIRWGTQNHGLVGASWEGQIDRGKLTLKLTYKEDSETRTWTQQCKARAPIASPVNSGSKNGAAGASSQSAKP